MAERIETPDALSQKNFKLSLNSLLSFLGLRLGYVKGLDVEMKSFHPITPKKENLDTIQD